MSCFIKTFDFPNALGTIEYAEPITPSPDHPDNAKRSAVARLLGKDDGILELP